MDRLSHQQEPVISELTTPTMVPGAAIMPPPQTVVWQPAKIQSPTLVLEAGIRSPDLPTVAWNSAPRIPPMIMEPDIAQYIAASEMSKATDSQMSSLLKNLKAASEKLDTTNKKKMQALIDRMDSILEKMAKDKQAKLAGDIAFGLSIAATIFSLLGSAALTFVTFGAAAPALIGAVISSCNTILDCVDRGLKEGGVKFESGPLKGQPATASFAGLMGSMYEAMMVSSPDFKKLPPEEQQKRIQGVHIAMAVITAITMLVVGVALSVTSISKVAADGVKVASTLSGTIGRAAGSLVGKGAEIAQIAADTANSVTALSASIFGSQLAYISFESAELDNQKQFLEAFAEAIQTLINMTQEAIENMQEMLAEFLEGIAQTNEEYYNVMSKVMGKY